jgi:hypothetical protein
MTYGSIDIHNDGSWLINIRGEQGENPFNLLAELIKANKERIEVMDQNAAALESITV